MMSLTFGLFTQVSGSGPLGPLVDIVYPPLLLSASSSVSIHCAIVGLSLLSQKTLKRGQTILVSVSRPGSEPHHIFQWLLGSFCEPPHW